jgi:glycosyltransferase involved in cell wall biosynthesis
MQASFRLVRALDSLADGRLELTVLTQSEHTTSRVVRSLPNGTKIIFAPQPKTLSDRLQFGYPAVGRALREIAESSPPDLIHAQGTAKYIYAAIRSKRPHVVTIHGIFQNEMKVVRSNLSLGARLARVVKVKLERHYIAGIRNLIAITREVADFVRQASPGVRIFEIDNAIDEAFFSVPPLPSGNPPNILFVAAITYRKGLDFLLESFPKVLDMHPDARLTIAGIWDWDPDYVARLQAQYAQLMAAGSVAFLGGISQDRLIEEMTKATLLCLPSRAESAPLVISQAMAASRAVLASKVGGIPDMVKDGQNGQLWTMGDVAGLSALLSQMLANHEATSLLGACGRRMALDRYSPRAVASKTLDAYLSIVGP